jgi:hypothetical protein
MALWVVRNILMGGGGVPGALGVLVVLADLLSATLALPLSLAIVLIAGGSALIVGAFRLR